MKLKNIINAIRIVSNRVLTCNSNLLYCRKFRNIYLLVELLMLLKAEHELSTALLSVIFNCGDCRAESHDRDQTDHVICDSTSPAGPPRRSVGEYTSPGLVIY